jgi:hypothetical protein
LRAERRRRHAGVRLGEQRTCHVVKGVALANWLTVGARWARGERIVDVRGRRSSERSLIERDGRADELANAGSLEERRERDEREHEQRKMALDQGFHAEFRRAAELGLTTLRLSELARFHEVLGGEHQTLYAFAARESVHDFLEVLLSHAAVKVVVGLDANAGARPTRIQAARGAGAHLTVR